MEFVPKINPTDRSFNTPKACPNRTCRANTWNIPTIELEIIKKNRNKNLLSHYYDTRIQKLMPILDKYKPKHKETLDLIICRECDILYHNPESLKRHQYRRHHGLCGECNSSNVYVQKIKKMNVCEKCLSSGNR